MSNSIQVIHYTNLSLAFIPVLVVVAIHYKWMLDYRNTLYATVRMIVQLLVIGYFLVYLIDSDSALLIILILAVMIFSASWIALRTAINLRQKLYKKALFSIVFGGGLTLLLITQGVLDLQPWYLPQYMIPIAGMIFASAMTSVSLAIERLDAEIKREIQYEQARNIAFQASLIPIINSLFAVGLVSLPGMMTGQILSGISPLIAVNYQIMVMCMIFGATGISSACFLVLVKPDFGCVDTNDRD